MQVLNTHRISSVRTIWRYLGQFKWQGLSLRVVGEAKGKSNTNKTSPHAPWFPPSKQYHNKQYHNKPDVRVIAFLWKLLYRSFSFLSHKSKKSGKEKHHEQFLQEGRREIPRNIICTEYKDCWMQEKKVYFQETTENTSSYFTSDGSVSTDQLPDWGDVFSYCYSTTMKKDSIRLWLRHYNRDNIISQIFV